MPAANMPEKEERIDLSAPYLNGKELQYVTNAIQSNWISISGTYVNELEKMIGNYINAPDRVVACQNATSGLHLALRLSGVEPGDEVIVPTLSFIAPINVVRYCYADPVFMDCDESMNMDMDKTAFFLKTECVQKDGKLMNKRSGKLIKAIIVVHVCGNMPDLAKARELADQYGLKLIEDSAEALGSYYTHGVYAGAHAGTIGDFGVFSFNSNKLITSGGGGVVICQTEELAKKMKYLSTQAKDDPLFYQHDEVGFNYRLTNVQAGMALAQMEQIESFIQNKENNFKLYQSLLNSIPGLEMISFNENSRPNYWFYSLQINKSIFGTSRNELLSMLSDANIESRPLWKLNHCQKQFKNCQSFCIERAPIFEREVLNIPSGNGLTETQVLKVCNVIQCAKRSLRLSS